LRFLLVFIALLLLARLLFLTFVESRSASWHSHPPYMISVVWRRATRPSNASESLASTLQLFKLKILRRSNGSRTVFKYNRFYVEQRFPLV
jgi:hypothetical protein